MRVLIAGCGRLGSDVGVRLANAGHVVYGLRRRTEQLPGQIQGLAGDLHDVANLESLLPPALDVVLHVLTPNTRDEAGYRRCYVDTLNNLLRCGSLQNPDQHWLFVSSTAVYGDAQGEWIDEDTVADPIDFNGRILLQAEQLLVSARSHSCQVRLGGIYGPGRTWLLDRMRTGAFQVQRSPPHWGNRIHSLDAVRLLLTLIEQRVCGIVNGVDQHPASEAEVADWLAARMGTPAPLSRSVSAGARANRRIASKRMARLGFVHRYPDYRSGYSSLLRTKETL